MKYRIIYRGNMWLNCWALQKRYKWWPFWLTENCYRSFEMAKKESELLRQTWPV